MKNTPYYFTLFLFLYIYSCSIRNGKKEVELDKDGKAMCASVDDCLACYDFERARKFVDRSVGNTGRASEDTKKITIAESKFWAEKGEIDRALGIIDESWGIDDYDWPEADWQAWKYNIIDIGVASCCEKGNYRQAKVYALKAADDLNVDGFKIGEGTGIFIGENGMKSDYNYWGEGKEIIAKGRSMRELLLKKISDYETINK